MQTKLFSLVGLHILITLTFTLEKIEAIAQIHTSTRININIINDNNNNKQIPPCEIRNDDDSVRSPRGGAVPSKKINKEAQSTERTGLLEETIQTMRELLESAVYAAIYAVLALLFAGWVDALFPRFDPKAEYNIPRLLFEVATQAGANAAAAQGTRKVVQKVPYLASIDGRSDKALPASGGGVVFAFLMFTRQSNWKQKVGALDALLDKTWLFP